MNKKFCLLTADSDDRPDFLEHCKYQAAKQTFQVPHLIISKKRIGCKPDLTQKIRLMFEKLVTDNRFTHVIIMENDDYYPNDYVENIVANDFDLLGIENTVYYNLSFRKFNKFSHPGRSALFCTAFKIEALLDYNWPPDDELYLDIHLWKTYNIWFTAQSLRSKIKFIEPKHLPIGIKHNVGFCPDNFHSKETLYPNDDSKLQWLIENIHRPDSFAFYCKIMDNLKYKALNIIKPY